jgi:hypothetical protein
MSCNSTKRLVLNVNFAQNKKSKIFPLKTYGAKASTQNTETFEVEGLAKSILILALIIKWMLTG